MIYCPVQLYSVCNVDTGSVHVDTVKAPLVRVLKTWTEASVIVASCRRLRSAADKGHVDGEEGGRVTVLFRYVTASVIDAGCVVQIFPPW